MLADIVKRHIYRGIEARIFSKLWSLVEKRRYRIALIGSRRSIHRLLELADADQRSFMHVRLGTSDISRIVPRLRHRSATGAGDVDLVIVPDQKNKQEIARRVGLALSDNIPVFVLPDDILSGRIRRTVEEAAKWPSQSPRLSYILASSRRTGSTLLCHLLRQTGVAGYPSEYIQQQFNAAAGRKRIKAGAVLIDALDMNQTTNGVFGIKVHWSAWDSFRESVLPEFDEFERQRFEGLLTDSKYIYLKRKNKIQQAISDWRAGHSRVFHVRLDAKERIRQHHRREIPYNYEELVLHLKSVVEDDESWRLFFKERGISPLCIDYEEMVARPAETVGKILGYLGLTGPHAGVTPGTEKLADRFTETIYDQFAADLSSDYGPEIVDVLTGRDNQRPRTPPTGPRRTTRPKTAVLVSLATSDYLDRAKQFFASAHFNGGWNGDYLLLAHEVPDQELAWFHDRGILVKHCEPLYDGCIGGMHPVMTSKFYMFTPWFKQWETVVYSDLDAIVRASLDSLKDTRGFAAVDDWSSTLNDQIVTKLDVEERGLDPSHCDELIRRASQTYQLHKRPFCAGFFAFSTEIIRDDTLEELQRMTDQYQLISKFGDQLALNLYFYKCWKKLNPTYNVLIRQKNYRDAIEGFMNVETRWGSVHDVSAYVLHIFDPKPWHPSSGFHLEWLANLRKAQHMHVSDTPEIDHRRVLEIRRTEKHIRFRQTIYNLLEGFGPAKVPTIELLHHLHWRYVTTKKLVQIIAGAAAGKLRRWRPYRAGSQS